MKLNVVYLMGNCEQFVSLTLKSVYEHVDKIIIVYDTTSRDLTLSRIEEWQDKLGDKIVRLDRAYEHDSKVKNANSNARSFYLDYLKKNHLGEWVLVLDADEVCDAGLQHLKSFLKTLEKDKQYLISPHMEHFINTFGKVDKYYPEGQQHHFVLNRLFNVHDKLSYPEGEHPVLRSSSENTITGNLLMFTIFHMGYCREMFYIRNRYVNHLEKSEMHKPDELQKWYYAHLAGYYPVKDFPMISLPKVIKEHFMIEDDYFYFKDRGELETKHLLMTHQWIKLFRLQEPYENGTKKEVLDVGCSLGHYVYSFNHHDVSCDGFDISKYAIENFKYKFLKGNVWVASVLDKKFKTDKQYELITFIDILEHLENEEEVNLALKNACDVGKRYFLFSIPFGKSEETGEPEDPNLRKDSTHKLFWSREKWIEVIEKNGIRLFKTPENFYYGHQILLGIKDSCTDFRVI